LKYFLFLTINFVTILDLVLFTLHFVINLNIQEGKVRWYFYFKLKEISKTRNNPLKRNIQQCDTEFLEMLKDVAVNPEEGCKVLRVKFIFIL